MSGGANIGVILLAAGPSSRLGQPKQLVRFEGKSLLQRMIDEVGQMSFSAKVLVSGGNSKTIFPHIDLKSFSRIENEKWKEGIGSSIRTAIRHALKITPDLEHLLCILSDQPLVNRAYLDRLIDEHLRAGKKITASQYGENTGVPTVFARAYFPDLLALKGDQGAKKIIKKAMGDTHLVNFPDGNFDVDTPADLQRLVSGLK